MATYTPNLNLYKPDSTDNFENFRAEFNNNMDILDNGGGGGGGFDFGAFINTNRIIQAQTAFRSSMTYTATEDCFVMFYIVLGVGATYIYIDGEAVSTFYNTQTIGDTQGLYLRKGQTVSVSNANAGVDSHYIVYGLMQGTQGVFSPVIYSDSERLIGIWRDNKPLYQRSFPLTVSLSGGQTATIATLSGVENIIHASGWLNENNIIYFLNDYSARIKISASGELQLTSATGSSWNGSGYITLQYTKTADVAGSGDWNTDGIPMVHYSTSEQVIGTWIDGKPLYRNTLQFIEGTEQTSKLYTAEILALNAEYVKLESAEVKFGVQGGNIWFTAPFYNDGAYNMCVSVSNTQINVIANGWKFTEANVTIQYTKTTD